ncbi:GDSL-type esterase/lipase family protein [Arthrobacter sp. STN4]|uniref:GDSL-type esterase/lipase family protein n=1 Tax=Arthrobacter sp. STN4 TaxID=2923276 RepID=UPI002119CBB1|nr:GDSL-type esterase/lipase family protein [Arthrobacter sp. STN4]MCQ9162692.1 GDSL-type esterase/lipase family protein [Arthrobacter sp. STN4]
MVSVPAQWTGLFRMDTDDDGARHFLRLDPSGYLPPSTDGLANRAAMPAGVRAGWRTNGGTLTVAGHGAEGCAPYDVVVNGRRMHRLPAAGPHLHEVDLADVPPHSTVVLWLPHFGDFTLQQATFDGGTVTPALEEGPRWITYGSSITHCQQADGPTQTWPALVAARNGWQLTNLGLAGECQLDPAAADTIAQTPADIISLCVGINSYNAATFSERTYAGAVHGFIATVRRAHPHVPMVVISPVLSLPREDKPNAVGWTLADYRAATANVVAQLRRRGDSRLHCIDGASVLTAQEAFERLPDTLHPDTAGYAIMAARLAPRLAAALA